MIVALLPWISFVFVAGAVLYGYQTAAEACQRRRLLQRLRRDHGAALVDRRPAARLRRLLLSLGRRLVPKKEAEVLRLQQQLSYAGYRAPASVHVYHGLCVILGVLFGGLAFGLLVPLGGLTIRSVAFAYVGVVVGYFLPKLLLRWVASARQRRLFRELPDALDVLLICMDAGLSFAMALQRVGRELRYIAPALSREFQQYFREVDSGLPRQRALRNMAERNGSDCLTSVVNILIQSTRFGTDIAQALRVHAGALRTERLQLAEEKGAKVSTKLVFPLIFLIMPALMVIILGPAAIRLLESFRAAF